MGVLGTSAGIPGVAFGPTSIVVIPDTVVAREDGPAVTINPLYNDYDSDYYNYSGEFPEYTDDLIIRSVDTTGLQGTVEIIEQTGFNIGSFDSNATLQVLSYTPPQNNFNGVETFTYEACDAANPESENFLFRDTETTCDTATVTVQVGAVNDTPEAESFEVQAKKNTATTLLDANRESLFLDNFRDVDTVTRRVELRPGVDDLEYFDLASIVVVTLPENGVLSVEDENQTRREVVAGEEITLPVLPSLRYAPDADFVGTDSFTWQVEDGGVSCEGREGESDCAEIVEDVCADPSDPSFSELCESLPAIDTCNSFVEPCLDLECDGFFVEGQCFPFTLVQELSNLATVNLVVADAELPSVASKVEIIEKSAQSDGYVFDPNDFGGLVQSNNQTLQQITIRRRPTQGVLFVNGAEYSRETIPIEEGIFPEIRYVPSPDAVGSDTLEFTVTTADGESNVGQITFEILEATESTPEDQTDDASSGEPAVEADDSIPEVPAGGLIRTGGY